MSEDKNKPQLPPTLRQKLPKLGAFAIPAEKLSETERIMMEKLFGYDGKSPVPSNLGEIMEKNISAEELARLRKKALLEAAAAVPPNQPQPTGIDPDKVPTQQLQEIPLDVAKSIEKYSKILETINEDVSTPLTDTEDVSAAEMTSIFEKARSKAIDNIDKQQDLSGIHPNIASAYQMLQDSEEVSAEVNANADRSDKNDFVQPEDKMEPVAEERANDRESIIATRKREVEAEKAKLNPNDITRFKQSIILGELYTKNYTCFDGNVQLIFSDCHGEDHDAILQQITIDKYKNRIRDSDIDGLNELYRRYNAAASLRVMSFQDAQGKLNERLSIPLSMSISEFAAKFNRDKLSANGLDGDDTTLRAWSLFLFNKLLVGSMRQVVFALLRKFQLQIISLQFVCQDPESF